MAIKDMTGRRFGMLVVLGLSHIHNKTSYWLCKCDCGNIKAVSRSSLTSGDTISCGCYHKAHAKEYGFKHGLSRNKLYSVWSGIKQRCCNKKAGNYYRYGGRGIMICDEWKNDFQCFYEWAINNGYKDGLTIDRIDNNGDYTPNNCRWATLIEQQNNTRRNHFITYNGITKYLTRWAKLFGVCTETLRYRVNNNNYIDLEKYFGLKQE